MRLGEKEMTIKQLAKELCKREGKRKQVDIAQMTEVLGRLADIFSSEWGEKWEIDFKISGIDEEHSYLSLAKLGEKRAKKKAKK